MNPEQSILPYLYGGGISLAAVVLLLYVVRAAVVQAVQHAAALEIDKRRHEFSRELEELKAQLTTKAERRRQVAAKQVEALEEIARAGRQLFKQVRDAGRDNVQAEIEALNRFGEIVHHHGHLVPDELVKFMFECQGEIDLGLTQFREHGDLNGGRKAIAATERLIARVRAELEIE